GSGHSLPGQGRRRRAAEVRDSRGARPTAGGSTGDAQAHAAGEGQPLRRPVVHPKVVRAGALSGGYSQKEGNERLRRNHGVVASFSRALLEGLSARQSEDDYTAVLDTSIERIFEASNT